MHEKNFTIVGSSKNKSAVEHAAEIIFTCCGLLAVVAVFSITLYMIISGTPALFKVGILDILFGTVWKPTADPASFGILYVILTSIVGTFLAILIGVPIGVFTAISWRRWHRRSWQPWCGRPWSFWRGFRRSSTACWAS